MKGDLQPNSSLWQIQASKILNFPPIGNLRAPLPKEKTHFEFTFSADAPHHLLEFEVGETRHMLTQLVLKE